MDIMRRIINLFRRRPTPHYGGWQDFEVGAYATRLAYPPPPTPEPAFINRALLVRGIPEFAGIGAQLVIPAADTFGAWLPLKTPPGTPQHEYKRDGMKVWVRRATPDLRIDLRS
jgi:hypothetical protein